MPTDIVFPDGNEKGFIELAEKLGYDSLVFVYGNASKIPKLMPKSKIKIKVGLLAGEKEIQKAKKKCDVALFKSTGNDRWVFEKSDVDIIFGLEEAQKKDYMHHRASGLNQVLCKIAAKKKKVIGFDFSSVLNCDKLRRAQILGKMMQNTKFCRKYKVKTVLASFAGNPYGIRAPNDLIAFGITIGMHPKEAKDAMDRIK